MVQTPVGQALSFMGIFKMKRSSGHVYVHLVWATHNREALVTPEIRAALYGCMVAKCQHLGCTIIAIGGMADHVHLLARLSSSVSCAKLAHDVKGSSSHLANQYLGPKFSFRWQRGYGAWSISPHEAPRIKEYITNQEQHHGNGTLIVGLEDCGDEEDPLE